MIHETRHNRVGIIQLSLKRLILHLALFVHELLLGVSPSGGKAAKAAFQSAGPSKLTKGNRSGRKAHPL